MKVLLINSSWPSYNLGIHKAQKYWERSGASVTVASEFPTLFLDHDVVWVSAIFSWHVPNLIAAASAALAAGINTEVGGPGTFGLLKEIESATGLKAQARPDPRFEREPGEYKMVFWSRGCPAKNCSLGFPRNGGLPICSVPEMEGWRYTLYDDVTPAPIISDNNLSALPRHHQELIVERTLAQGFKSVDANSGFEPRSIRPWVIENWKRLPLKCWRFAYDEQGEREAVLRTIALLDDAEIPRRRLHIYCLAGNEPVSECEKRVHEINSLGAFPIVQRRRPLSWDGISPLPCLFDWNPQLLINFQRWGNRLAKGMDFASYRRGQKDPKECHESQLRIIQ